MLRNSLRLYRDATGLFDRVIHAPRWAPPSRELVAALQEIRAEILPVLANEALPSSGKVPSPELVRTVRALLTVRTSPSDSRGMFNLAEAVWDGTAVLWKMFGDPSAKFYRGVSR